MSGGRTLQRIRHGGLFYPGVGIEALSSIVAGRHVLSRVIDPHSLEELQEIRAPYEKSAIFQTRPGFRKVNSGDYALLRPAVSVKDGIGTNQTPPVGQLDGVADELGEHVLGHRVAHDFAVVQVDRHGVHNRPSQTRSYS